MNVRNDQDDFQTEQKDIEDQNTRFLRAYKILIKRNKICSSALGMCPKCWGTDKNCECLGEGGPGSIIPERFAFEILVKPVLKTLGMFSSEETKKLINDHK